jgi:hypothetical protein
MNTDHIRALDRLVICERALADFDSWRDDDDPAHHRILRKLRNDLAKALADVRWAERLEC